MNAGILRFVQNDSSGRVGVDVGRGRTGFSVGLNFGGEGRILKEQASLFRRFSKKP